MKCSFCEKEIQKKVSFSNLFTKQKDFVLCEECKKIIDINIYEIDGENLYYFAKYEDVKELIYEIKYFGAVHKVKKFEKILKLFFKKYTFDLVTIVPTNKIRGYIRSFNHVEQLCTLCNVPYSEVFYCDYRPKQAKLHKKRTEHKFYILEDFLKKNLQKEVRTILIIDDIFTSGNTLLSCARELEKLYPQAKISFLTLSFSGQKSKK